MPPPDQPPVIVNAPPGLLRLRRMAWVLDRLIPIGKSGRVGLEPLLGLIPALGDWLGAGLSVYVLYEAAKLGLPWSTLLRMAGNVVLDSAIGTVPVAGDLFDFFWQANMRNVRLVEQAYHPGMKRRSFAKLWLALLGFVAGLMLLIGLCVYAVWSFILGLFG